MGSHTSLGQPPLMVVAAAFRAVVNMEALDLEMATGLMIAIETKDPMKKKKITKENHTMPPLVTIKRTPSRRVLLALPGRTYLASIMA